MSHSHSAVTGELMRPGPNRGLQAAVRQAHRLRYTVAVTVTATLVAAPARAQSPFTGGAVGLLYWLAWAGGLIAAGWALTTALLEAHILNSMLKLGYRRALKYSFLMNLASVVLGGLWQFLLGGQGGWRQEALAGGGPLLLFLMLRSFMVTVAEEGIVAVLLMRRQRRTATVLMSVGLANVGSYVVLFAIFAAIAMMQQP